MRKWESGDYIVPLGMRGKKKVSDILVDKKIDLISKELVNVFESNGELKEGIISPELKGELKNTVKIGRDYLKIFNPF